jgi:uncharacterized membrane protein
MKKQLHTFTFARCGCPAIHWAVRGSFIGCAECRAAGLNGVFVTRAVGTYTPRKVRKEIEAATTNEQITAIIEREYATLRRGRAA